MKFVLPFLFVSVSLVAMDNSVFEGEGRCASTVLVYHFNDISTLLKILAEGEGITYDEKNPCYFTYKPRDKMSKLCLKIWRMKGKKGTEDEYAIAVEVDPTAIEVTNSMLRNCTCEGYSYQDSGQKLSDYLKKKENNKSYKRIAKLKNRKWSSNNEPAKIAFCIDPLSSEVTYHCLLEDMQKFKLPHTYDNECVIMRTIEPHEFAQPD